MGKIAHKVGCSVGLRYAHIAFKITKIILYDEILKTLFIVCTYRKNDGTSPNLSLTIINVSACNENTQSASLNGPKSVLMGKT